MDRYDISVQQLHVVALSCLLLASKYVAPYFNQSNIGSSAKCKE